MWYILKQDNILFVVPIGHRPSLCNKTTSNIILIQYTDQHSMVSIQRSFEFVFKCCIVQLRNQLSLILVCIYNVLLKKQCHYLTFDEYDIGPMPFVNIRPMCIMLAC